MMHYYRKTYCQRIFCVYFVYLLITCGCLYLHQLYCRVICQVFLNKFSPVDQFLCPLFKKQRRRFLPVKLCTVKVKIFLYCEFICKFSFSNIYFPTRVQNRRRLDGFIQMMNTITLDFGYMPVEFRRDRGVQSVLLPGIRLVGITHRHILEKITQRAQELN